MNKKLPLAGLIAVAASLLSGCSGKAPATGSPDNVTAGRGAAPHVSDPVDLVSVAMQGNKQGIAATDLLSRKNPRGEGVFVYVAPHRFQSTVGGKRAIGGATLDKAERTAVWMVIDSRALSLNSSAQMLAPSLPWPRQGDLRSWKKTNINLFSGATEAMNILFPEPSPSKAAVKK